MQKTIVFFCILTAFSLTTVFAQSFNLSFENPQLDGTTFTTDIFLSFSVAGKLGSSNLLFSYDNNVLSNPSIQSDNISDAPTYLAPSLTQPSTGIASLNIELAIPGSGDPIAAGPSSTLIATLAFTLDDPNAAFDLTWLTTGSVRTVIFLDDEATLLNAGTATNLSNVLFPKVSAINKTDETCDQNNGSISFTFPDEPSRGAIEFSLDGGNTYQPQVNDNSGSATYSNLAPDTYDLFVRWGNNEYPVDLGSQTIAAQAAPNVTNIAVVDEQCEDGNGQITFSFADEPTRTGIEFSLDDQANYQASVNDNSGSVSYGSLAPGDYILYVRWGNDECPTSLGTRTVAASPNPQTSSVTVTDESCEDANGKISIAFPNEPSQTEIAFSFDGGNTYRPNIADNQGSIEYTNFAPGTYDLFVRWGDQSCPQSVGNQTVGPDEIPTVSGIVPTDEVCGNGNGSLEISFPNDADRTNIQFSLDGGNTYQASVADNSGSVSYGSLAPGNYSVFARWGNGDCPTSISTETIDSQGVPQVSSINPTDASCGLANGSLALNFPDSPDQTGIEFSLDGGNNYAPEVPDNSGSQTFSDLSPGTYGLFVRWGNNSCPVDLGNVNIGGPAPSIGVELTAILEGPYSGGQMQDNLRASSLITTTDPYTGSQNTPASTFNITGPSAIVDWVEIQLRSSSDPTQIIGSTAALLQVNGSVVSTPGCDNVSFPGVGAGTYHVVVNHYNHLPVMSANALNFNTVPSIDFTDPVTNVYQVGGQALKNDNGTMVMWSGDGSADGTINAIDKNLHWRPQNGQPYTYGTTTADYNLDGAVNAIDLNLFWRVNNSRIGQIP